MTALLATTLLATTLLTTTVLATVTMAAPAAAAQAVSRPGRAVTAPVIPANRDRPPATGSLAGPIYSRIPGICLSYHPSMAARQLVAGIGRCSRSRSQRWRLPPDNTIQIAGRCLQAAGTAARSRVIIARCNGTSSQFWETDGVAMVPGVELLNPATGMCLEDPGSATAEGTPVQLNVCGFSAAQVWYPPPTHPGDQSPPAIASPLVAAPVAAAVAAAGSG